MARTLLDYFSNEQTKPLLKEEAKAEAPPSSSQAKNNEEMKQEEAKQLKKKRPSAFPPVAPENLPASYFVSASYDGRQKKVVIKLYEPESGQIYFWYDNTGHKPYCLTNLTQYELEKIDRLVKHEGFDRFEIQEKFDPLNDQKIQINKNNCK